MKAVVIPACGGPGELKVEDRPDPVDTIADTVSGPVADQLMSKVKKGGTFASVLVDPDNAAAYPGVRVETMQVELAPATLLHLAADAGKAHIAAEKGAAGKLLLLA